MRAAELTHPVVAVRPARHHYQHEDTNKTPPQTETKKRRHKSQRLNVVNS